MLFDIDFALPLHVSHQQMDQVHQKSIRSFDKAPYCCFYFSASWCAPCKALTHMLSSAYNENEAEIILVCLDATIEAAQAYFRTMPWKALAFHDRDTRNQLIHQFQVAGIPRVVVVDRVTGAIVNYDARAAILQDVNAIPWREPNVQDIDLSVMHRGRDINTSVAAVLIVPPSLEDHPCISAYEKAAVLCSPRLYAVPRFQLNDNGAEGKASTKIIEALGCALRATQTPRLVVMDVPHVRFYEAPPELDLQDYESVLQFLGNFHEHPPQSFSH